jgi:prevent-host-death family protein
MIIINLDDISHDLAGYLNRVQSGETIVITKNDQPVAQLKPLSPAQDLSEKGPRPFGLAAGEFIVPDDFDAPLPEDILRDFAA